METSVAMFATYRGRPIADLTREELEQALHDAWARLREATSPDAFRERALGRIERIKRVPC